MNAITTIPTDDPKVVTQLGGGDVLVVAEQPGEMQAAQAALIKWATDKCAAMKQELDDAEESLAQATAAGLRLTGVRKVLKTAAVTLDYYEKIKAALEAGYCIVPDFPVDIVAIRTEATRASGRTETNGWTPTLEQQPEVLPEGEGQYFSPNPEVHWAGERQRKNEKGEVVQTLTIWDAGDLRSVSLPVKFLKPRVLEATRHAMAAKIFDEIGILPARPKKDPLIVGRIIDPKGKRLAFLISWFVDSRDL